MKYVDRIVFMNAEAPDAGTFYDLVPHEAVPKELLRDYGEWAQYYKSQATPPGERSQWIVSAQVAGTVGFITVYA